MLLRKTDLEEGATVQFFIERLCDINNHCQALVVNKSVRLSPCSDHTYFDLVYFE